MNALTHEAEVCEFATVEDLLATPIVRRFAGPEYTHLAFSGTWLFVYDDSHRMLRLIGRLKEPMRIPKGYVAKRPEQQQ